LSDEASQEYMREEKLMTAKPQPAEEASNAAVVYDRVTQAWQLMMGNDLHFGVFAEPDTQLPDAAERLTRKMAEWAQLDATTRVLDVGCGIGGPALTIASWSGCHVTGISTSQVGVQTASRRAEAAGLAGRVEFLVRDGMANGFPDAAFDRVWIMESSHLMEQKEVLLAESARVLRPGGSLVLCDIVVRNTIPFQYLVRNLAEFENLNTVFGKQHVAELNSYTQAAEKAGLTAIRTADISAEVFPTMENWRRNATLHRDALLDLIGDEYLAQFVRACSFLERLWSEQRLGYAMLVAQKPA
jgi:cyclopropane fatty-acyl-phospholipid synthase-like methyltransferase